MGYHLDKSHDGQVADVAYRCAAYSGHQVAAPETELRIGILLT